MSPDPALVEAARHAEEPELVAAAVDTDVVVAERAGDEDPVRGGPAEGVAPVRAEGGRPLGVVVVAERHEGVDLPGGREALDGGAGQALRPAADAEVADGEDAGVGRRGRRREQRRRGEGERANVTGVCPNGEPVPSCAA